MGLVVHLVMGMFVFWGNAGGVSKSRPILGGSNPGSSKRGPAGQGATAPRWLATDDGDTNPMVVHLG